MPNRGMSGLEKAKYVLFGKSQNSAYVWQDREVRFDCPVSALDCRPGETLIDTMVTALGGILAHYGGTMHLLTCVSGLL